MLRKVGKTAIIILEYNNSIDTINCIDSVLKFNSSPIKFIVVDNGSTKREVVSELAGYFNAKFHRKWMRLKYNQTSPSPLPYLSFLENSSNIGYAQGNNKALALADNDPEIDNILILNSDILFVEDILPSLTECLNAKADAAIVSPVLFKKDLNGTDGNCARRALSANEVVWKNFPFPYDAFKINKRRKLDFKLNTGLMNVELPSGSCMLMRKDLFKKLGWFDPGTFLYYEEDILFEKTKSLGLQNYLDTNSRCIHLGATTTKSSPSSFVIGCEISSAKYYLKKYRNASSLQLSALQLFSLLLQLKLKIKRILHI